MTDIQHGSWSAYRKHRCRCRTCRDWANRGSNLLRLRRLRGESGFMPKQPVVDHINMLLANGMTMVDIVEQAGFSSPSSLCQFMKRPAEKMQRAKGRKLLAVKPSMRPGSRAMVTATGSMRRLRALARMGWGIVAISQATGISTVTITYVRNGQKKTVSAGVHQRIVEFYQKHEVTPGPSKGTAELAAKNKWLPPLAWDDIDTDRVRDAWDNVTLKRQGFKTL